MPGSELRVVTGENGRFRIYGVRPGAPGMPPATVVYTGAATIPLQYKRLGVGFCGLMLVWRRD
jgi:hypothetical protein